LTATVFASKSFASPVSAGIFRYSIDSQRPRGRGIPRRKRPAMRLALRGRPRRVVGAPAFRLVKRQPIGKGASTPGPGARQGRGCSPPLPPGAPTEQREGGVPGGALGRDLLLRPRKHAAAGQP